MIVVMAAAIMMFAVLAIQGGFVRDRGSLSFDMFGYSLIAAFSTSLIAFVATAKNTPLCGLLSRRWIVYLGTISYMMYLIHGQAIHVTLGIGRYAVIARTVAMFASIGFASLSWHLVESPILGRKTRRMANVVT
jgi:peptidoglycan/LPS O-acetylase OafA/YrhL